MDTIEDEEEPIEEDPKEDPIEDEENTMEEPLVNGDRGQELAQEESELETILSL